jgi:hypothetical protein
MAAVRCTPQREAETKKLKASPKGEALLTSRGRRPERAESYKI